MRHGTSARSNFSVIPARVSGARVWRARGIPNSAGGRGEGPGFFARQPRARMTEQEIEQDRNCHYDLQSLNRSCPRAFDFVRAAHFAPKEKTAAFVKCSLCGGRRGFLLACRVVAPRVTCS